jgi:signal transduction histidine kinase
VRYEKSGDSRTVDQNTAIHVYRVLQEALNNVARHSQTKQADVRLRFSPDELVLEVEDAGVGFNNAAGGRGMGLVSMRERAEMVNGRLEILDGRGSPERNSRGALVRLTAPMTASEQARDAAVGIGG